MLLYDPPSGWMYGFPKPYQPREGESLKDTLIRDGMPADLPEHYYTHVRFIGDLEELKARRERESR